MFNAIINGQEVTPITMERGLTENTFKGITLEIEEYDGVGLQMKGSDGNTYIFESEYEDQLQCWVVVKGEK